MAAKVFGVGIPAAIGLTWLERTVLPGLMPALFKVSSAATGLTHAHAVPILATTAASFWLVLYGFTVGAARTKYAALARKDGEKDVDARYALPNLYVDGNTKHARAFNCVQRSHQQAFETLPQFLFFTAAASILHPLTAAANVTMWLIGRMTWSSGYARSEGDPSKRYDHPLAFLIFSSVIAQFLVSVITGGEILGRGLFF